MITLFSQPVMKLIGSISAIGFADTSDLFVFKRALFFCIELQLNRTLLVLAEFSSFVFYISFY